MLSLRTAAVAVGLGLGALPRAASAQIDYRNLDDERPVATEDAYPIERYAFELLVPYRYERMAGGESLHLFGLEAGYGVYDNAQLGIELPFAGVDPADPGETEWGLAGVELFALYNLNTESPTLPALSLRSDMSLPVGALAGEATRLSLKAIATRSWGFYRFHFNVSRSFGSEDAPGAAEVLPRWSYGFAVDRTLFRRSVLLVGEIVTRRPVAGAPAEVNAAIGARYQWSPTVVTDIGIARRLRNEAGPDLALTIGLSHAFGLDWLMPARAR